MQGYIAIEEEFGMLLHVTGPKNDTLVFQTSEGMGNNWHVIKYLPVVTKEFTEMYKTMYSNLNLHFYETETGTLLEFWKNHPHIFSSWKLERFIKCDNTLVI